MADVLISNAIPKNLEWWGIGREPQGSAGTITAPSVTIPLNTGDPDDKANMLVDKSIRGDMGEDYDELLGTLLADFPLSGNVYLDSIGHLLYNLFGDYTATGSTPGTAWTTSSTVAVGATALPVTTGAVAAAGTFVQIEAAGSGKPTEVCVVGTGSTSTSIVLAAPGTRFSHATAITVTPVTAPFTHTFALLNGGGTAGLPANAQPITHTITHYDGLAAAHGARQYGYWCASAIDFTMNLNNLFQHSTKGTSYIGKDAASAVTNSQTDAGAHPTWRFAVGIGGPASGGTLVSNVEQAALSPVRQLVPKYSLANQQDPVGIYRLGLSATGSLTYIAQDESPLLTYLAGTQQQLQLAMTNGLTGSSEQGITFNFSRAQFEAAQLSDPDVMAYNVGFRALMNPTDVGVSGARGPMTVTLINSVPTY